MVSELSNAFETTQTLESFEKLTKSVSGNKKIQNLA